jgi:hypothetical protein
MLVGTRSIERSNNVGSRNPAAAKKHRVIVRAGLPKGQVNTTNRQPSQSRASWRGVQFHNYRSNKGFADAASSWTRHHLKDYQVVVPARLRHGIWLSKALRLASYWLTRRTQR